MASHLYLAIQSSYHCLQLALFSEKTCLQKQVLLDTRASSHLILHIDALLKNNRAVLADLSFIAVDAGPGAFTSLRVAIASINGIGFGYKVLLVGVDGLEALLHDGLAKASAHDNSIAGVLALLNAYNHDAYFGIASRDGQRYKQKGCKKIQEVIQEVLGKFPDGNILVLGNGATVFATELNEAFKGRLVIEQPIQEVPHVERIGVLGYQLWQEQKEARYRITPNYLKSQLFAVKKN